MANPPTWANVKLLCHFDGTNGQTTTVDSSPSAHTMGRNGSAALSTTQSKFGGASLSAGGLNAFLETDAGSADFNFGSGQFTVEGWVYFTTLPSTNVRGMVQRWHGGGSQSFYFGMVSGSLAFYYSTNGSDNPNVGAAWTPTINTWYHLAADRDASNVLRVYVDGVVWASSTVTATIFNPTSGNDFIYIGGDALPAIDGYIDEVRLVKGEAVYGGAFTAPTSPFGPPSTGRPQVFVCT